MTGYQSDLMRNVFVIFEREFLAYFNGALAYIIIPVFLLMVGAFGSRIHAAHLFLVFSVFSVVDSRFDHAGFF